jgi:hypothetical protein
MRYRVLFCTSALACPAPGAPGTVLGYPACVYGFFMYLLIATVSLVGLRRGRHQVAITAGYLPGD